MILRIAPSVLDVDAATKQQLNEDGHHSLSTHFEFPEEVSVACQQYLLYFAQFLRDIGIDAKTELRHSAGEVLFTVTPSDEHEALETVRDALDTYLRLPGAVELNISAGADSDLSLHRLVANIHHLQGQIALASAMLQLKEATIEQQRMTIEHQRGLLSGEVVANSLRTTTDSSKDQERLLGGIVSLTSYEGKGFKIDLPEIYRRLKSRVAQRKKSDVEDPDRR